MTTPPTPAGWYPDPDGAGGQRYWDGSAWTEHRTPAPPAPPAPAEAPGIDEPTAIVRTFTPPDEPSGGAHRRPDPHEEPEPPAQTIEPVAQPAAPDLPPPPPSPPSFETPPPPSFETPPPPADFGSSFETPPPPADFGSSFETPPPPGDFGSSSDLGPLYDAPPSGPLPPAPLFDAQPPGGPPQDGDGRKKLITAYAAACAALLLVLLGTLAYGLFIRDNPGAQVASPGSDTSTSESSKEPTETSAAESSETATKSPTEAGGSSEGTDGDLSFTVHGVEVGTTVASSDAPIEKEAQGQFVVVHMTVANVGQESATFVGMFQQLTAGGAQYNIDDEATAYLGGTFADLEPGASADVSIAFDVPVGTDPEGLVLHADPSTPGVEFSVS